MSDPDTCLTPEAKNWTGSNHSLEVSAWDGSQPNMSIRRNARSDPPPLVVDKVARVPNPTSTLKGKTQLKILNAPEITTAPRRFRPGHLHILLVLGPSLFLPPKSLFTSRKGSLGPAWLQT